MKRSEAISRLRSCIDAIKARGAVSLYLFGSTAQDQADDKSDVDLFLEYDPRRRFSLVDLVDIKHFLEDELGAKVDITTRDSLHPKLRGNIEKSAIRVF